MTDKRNDNEIFNLVETSDVSGDFKSIDISLENKDEKVKVQSSDIENNINKEMKELQPSVSSESISKNYDTLNEPIIETLVRNTM